MLLAYWSLLLNAGITERGYEYTRGFKIVVLLAVFRLAIFVNPFSDYLSIIMYTLVYFIAF